MVKKLSVKQAAKKRSIGSINPNVKIQDVSMRTMKYIHKRDAKIFAALAKCDTSGSRTS